MGTVFLGSQERYAIYMPPVGITTMKSAQWEVKVKAAREYIIPKSNAIYINDNQYDIIVDTAKVGVGALTIQLCIHVADSDAPEGTRLQNIRIFTDDTIVL